MHSSLKGEFRMSTGHICHQSGVYASNCHNEQIPLSKGERFPPCHGHAATWRLIQAL
jgi:hypothetical protein